MKSFQDVEQARMRRHLGQDGAGVHRSSLIAPRMPGAATQIAFLNHFLLKRKIASVTCRLTAIDTEGGVVGAKSVRIERPIVYAIDLDAMFEDDDRIGEYMVEFFSDQSLGVPFPAVMVNHHGADFLNVVHSYNRTLNDIFEDAEVNRHAVSESSIEVEAAAPYDTFFDFATGPFAPSEPIEVVVSNGGTPVSAHAPSPAHRPGMTHAVRRLSDILPRASLDAASVLKIRQPHQPLFYGRLLVRR